MPPKLRRAKQKGWGWWWWGAHVLCCVRISDVILSPPFARARMQVAVAFNFIVYAQVVVHYLFVWRREKFLMDYLEVDPDVPESHLVKLQSTFPEVIVSLYWHNRRVFLSAIALAVMFVINLILYVSCLGVTVFCLCLFFVIIFVVCQ